MDIKSLQKKYKLNKDEFWQVRSGTWVIKHDAVEKIATQEKIVFEEPKVFTENNIIAMLGFATLGKKRVWTTGEASDQNVGMAGKYYYAMSEKRLKDRLTLKLINAYEYGIYSDVEADFEKPTKKTVVKEEGITYEKTDTSIQEIPVCSVCNEEMEQKKTGNRSWWGCINWRTHKDNNEKFTAVFRSKKEIVSGDEPF